MRAEVYSFSDTGRVRTHNEDAVHTCALPDGANLLVLCDGMGGHAAGDIASRTAIAAVVDALGGQPTPPDPVSAIYDAIQAAQLAVQRAATEADGSNMGTTLVLALQRDALVWFGWVGDSRAYLFRDGEVLQRSEDHTRVAELVRRGIIRQEEARNHPDGHILTRAIGGGGLDIAQPTVWQDPTELEPGDVILLSSDGVHDLIEDDDLARWASSSPPDLAARHIAQVVHERGAHDNLTLAILRYGASDAGLGASVSSAPRRTLPDASIPEPPAPLSAPPPPPGPELAPASPQKPAIETAPATRDGAPPSTDEQPPSRAGMIALAVAGTALATFILLILGLAIFLGGRALLSDSVKPADAPASNSAAAAEEDG